MEEDIIPQSSWLYWWKAIFLVCTASLLFIWHTDFCCSALYGSKFPNSAATKLKWIINCESHQQFLSLPGLKDNEISQDVHVDVATVVDDVPILAKDPDVVIGQRDSL